MLSTLNYFKLHRRDQLDLPDPCGSLSTSLPPSAIASANREVEALLKTTNGSSYYTGKRGAHNRKLLIIVPYFSTIPDIKSCNLYRYSDTERARGSEVMLTSMVLPQPQNTTQGC